MLQLDFLPLGFVEPAAGVKLDHLVNSQTKAPVRMDPGSGGYGPGHA